MSKIKRSLKVIHLNYTDIYGGAGRAAFRIHCSLLDKKINSKMWVNRIFSKDRNITGPKNKFEKILAILKPLLLISIFKCFKAYKFSLRSISIFPSKWIKRINDSNADIVHLHWVQGEMISISDVSKIKKPVVWTLHDMWAFCGTEHYANNFRWRNGYKYQNKNFYGINFDLNRWVWMRKKKNWSNSFEIVTPSKWLYNCVRQSKLMSNWSVTSIPNPINIAKWQPLEKKYSRKKLNLPKNKLLILFGAMDGDEDVRKGFDLLIQALEYLEKNSKFYKLELVTFGNIKKLKLRKNFPIHFMDHIHDDHKLRMLYSAADAVVVPSRQDNLPNIAVEAQVCGTPVVAYNVGGLSDIVLHKKTGYLAVPFSIKDLANGIKWVLNSKHSEKLNKQSKLYASKKFSDKSISKSYLKVYRKAIKNWSLKLS